MVRLNVFAEPILPNTRFVGAGETPYVFSWMLSCVESHLVDECDNLLCVMCDRVSTCGHYYRYSPASH